MLKGLSRLFSLLAAGDLFAMIYFAAAGFPPEIAGHVLKLKNMRKPFILFLVFILLALISHPDRKARLLAWKKRIEAFAAKPSSVILLAVLYGLVFLWQQMTDYWAVDINFLPFSFYDYILYFLAQGKVNFTGLLHGYYHLNNILMIFTPFWEVFRSPLVLVMSYGFIASAAILPLYGIARERFGLEAGSAVVPFFIALLYLNFRYLQNVLQMGFCVEIFYPLFVFSALFFALKRKWPLYYVAVFLGLSVKEDSFIYFSAVGVLVFFLKERKHGALTVLFSLLYFLILVKWFVPFTENTILRGDIRNFGKEKTSITAVLRGFIGNPAELFQNLFLDPHKWRTLFKLLSRLAFVPLFSPALVLVAAPLLPLFLQAGGTDTSNFVDLRFHYAAAVIPFVFIAFVFGLSNLCRRMSGKYRDVVLWSVMILLLFLNGGSYVTQRVTPESLESIAWAKSVPAGANLVTHGHLLPYVGYRKYNYYFAGPFELKEHPEHRAYSNADYYLIDMNVLLYPMDEGYFQEKLMELGSDERYSLIRQEGKRWLFKKKGSRE